MASDPFFIDPSKKRKRKSRERSRVGDKFSHKKQRAGHRAASDVAPESSGEDEVEKVGGDIFEDESEDNEEDVITDEDQAARVQEEEEEEKESAADKRRRLAKQYLEDLKQGASAEGSNGEFSFDAKDLDREIIESRLQKDVAEQKGSAYKQIGGRLQIAGARVTKRRVATVGLTSLAVRYPYLYTVSKDMELAKWDIKESGKKPRKVKYVRGGPRFAEIKKDASQNGHSDEILALAVSPNGQWVVTGGKDKRLVVWSGENLACQRAMLTSRRNGEVYGLAFRRNTEQLYAACGDLKVRTYNIGQQAQLETLYGHQDIVEDISALSQERCVTVGGRDRTAMLWKIPDETRLTFRGGDSIEKFQREVKKLRHEMQEAGQTAPRSDSSFHPFYVEGSIDCVSMIDDGHFVTGSDNGNISLWSLAKKKPIFIQRQAHGLQPSEIPQQASAEKDEAKAAQQIPAQNPYWITTIHAVPYSDVFVSGSWNGTLKVWKLSEGLRQFTLLAELPGAKGVVNRIDDYEDEKNSQIRIYAALSKEHRLGRWIKAPQGSRNAIYTAVIDLGQPEAAK